VRSVPHDVQVRAWCVPLTDLSIVVIAIAGMSFFWSQYSFLSGLSWWYDSTQNFHERIEGRRPDYDLRSLSWNVVRPRVFDIGPDGIAIVTSEEPFAYQAYATIETGSSVAVDFQFEAEVDSGGVTIGLLQDGRWIATNSSQTPGIFTEGNSARLKGRSATVMIANDNPAGESRLIVKSLRLFFRK
jgi:hypothetical protein